MPKVRTKKASKKKVADAIANGVLKTVKVKSIDLWDKNPRKNEKAVKPLAKLLKKHGQVTPVVVHTGDNMIRKGNTTYKAMKENGEKEISVLFVDFPSEAAANAYALADNKASEWADWDDNIVTELMAAGELGEMDDLLESTGFSEKELELFSREMNFNTEHNEMPDVDFKGKVDNASDYIIVIFSEKEKKNYKKLKKKLGMNDRTRNVKYGDFKKALKE